MEYIVRNPNTGLHYVKTVKNATDATYGNLKRDGFDVKGQFGRLDYAIHWAEWFNGDITLKKHKQFLNRR